MGRSVTDFDIVHGNRLDYRRYHSSGSVQEKSEVGKRSVREPGRMERFVQERNDVVVCVDSNATGYRLIFIRFPKILRVSFYGHSS